MNGIVETIVSFKPLKEAGYEALKGQLEKQMQTMRANQNSLVQALSVLDPNQHTMGMCYLLYIKVSTARDGDTSIMVPIERFFNGCNANQIRDLCADKFAAVVHAYAIAARPYPERGALSLLKVVSRFPDTQNHLSPAHAEFLMLCLLAKNYKLAKQLIEKPIYEIEPKRLGVEPRDYMGYFYYAGIVYIGLGDLQRALESFGNVLSTPASAISHIMVEAYKKFQLVALLRNGKSDAMPKHCSTIVQRLVKKMVQPEYHEFIISVETKNKNRAQTIAQTHCKTFARDVNLGLVEQVLAKLSAHEIQRMTSTYLTLPLAVIAEAVGYSSPKEVEKVLLQMIAAGELKATINQREGMVSFQDKQQRGATTQSEVEEVEECMESVQKIVARLEAMAEDISSSKDYMIKSIIKDPTLREEFEIGARKGRGVMDSLSGMLRGN